MPHSTHAEDGGTPQRPCLTASAGAPEGAVCVEATVLLLWGDTPLHVAGLERIKAVAAGDSHSIALKEDGNVWAWGWGQQGQIGDGTKSSRSAPVQVLGLTGVTAIAAGSAHSVALKSDGTVWSWGGLGWPNCIWIPFG